MAEANTDRKLAEGILLMEKNKAVKILCEDELVQVLGMERHLVQNEPMVSSRTGAAAGSRWVDMQLT
nr:unnamed protein product [Digitaria exilis]